MNPQDIELIVRLLIGIVVLLAGRNIFWLFVGLAGFIVGMEVAGIWFADQPAWLTVLVAAGLGVIGAILAVVLRRVAFSVAGFYAAAFLAISVHKEMTLEAINPLIIFIAGLAGAVISALVMDTAIIVLSALAGSAAIVSALTVSKNLTIVLFVSLAAIGMAVQYRVMSRQPGN